MTLWLEIIVGLLFWVIADLGYLTHTQMGMDAKNAETVHDGYTIIGAWFIVVPMLILFVDGAVVIYQFVMSFF
jgi:hypothetical protein